MSDLSYGEVEAWLKARRDEYERVGNPYAGGWAILDAALDDFREHAHTGTPLGEPVRRHREQG